MYGRNVEASAYTQQWSLLSLLTSSPSKVGFDCDFACTVYRSRVRAVPLPTIVIMATQQRNAAVAYRAVD